MAESESAVVSRGSSISSANSIGSADSISSTSSVRGERISVDLALLAVRVAAGLIMTAHGAQKMFGVWGGPGLGGVMGPQGPGGGGVVGLLVAIGEFFGGLGLLFGLLSRFSAAANILIMLGAIAMVHGKNGFFLSNGGFEYNLALLGLFLPVLLAGPGRFSVAALYPWRRSGRNSPALLALE